MGRVYKFRRRRKKPQFKPRMIAVIALIGLVLAYYLMPEQIIANFDAKDQTSVADITCHAPYVNDGDTFRCNGTLIRMQGIDAPEMDGKCRKGRKCVAGDPIASRNYLISLTRGRVDCHQTDIDSYGRTVARCYAGDVDLSCAMVKNGHAIKRYAPIKC